MKRIIIIAAIAAAIVTAGFSRKPKDPPVITPTYNLADLAIRQHDFLGVSFPGDVEGYYQRIADAGGGRALINADWSMREPSLDSYNWPPMDGRIQAMGRAGIKLTVTLVSNAEKWTKPTSLRAGNRVPTDLAHWQRFVRAVVERYDGDGLADCPGIEVPVLVYNMGNEWNSPNNASGGWAGTVPELMDYFRTTYAAIKEACPSATVVMGGLPSGVVDKLTSGDLAPNLVAQIKSIIADTPADIVDFHQYGPEFLLPAKAARMTELAGGRPLVANEGGGPNLSFTPYSGIAHFQAVLGTNLEAFGAGMQYFMWFRLVESDQATAGNVRVGLLGRDGQTKPGYRAYFLVAALLDGATSVNGHNPYWIDYTNGTHRMVAWTNGPENRYTELGGSVMVVDDVETGAYRVLPPGAYPIGPMPVIVGPELSRRD